MKQKRNKQTKEQMNEQMNEWIETDEQIKQNEQKN